MQEKKSGEAALLLLLHTDSNAMLQQQCTHVIEWGAAFVPHAHTRYVSRCYIRNFSWQHHVVVPGFQEAKNYITRPCFSISGKNVFKIQQREASIQQKRYVCTTTTHVYVPHPGTKKKNKEIEGI